MSSSDEITVDSASKLKVDELKAAIKRRGSSFGGKEKKADLLAKLVTLLKEECSAPEPQPEATVDQPPISQSGVDDGELAQSSIPMLEVADPSTASADAENSMELVSGSVAIDTELDVAPVVPDHTVAPETVGIIPSVEERGEDLDRAVADAKEKEIRDALQQQMAKAKGKRSHVEIEVDNSGSGSGNGDVVSIVSTPRELSSATPQAAEKEGGGGGVIGESVVSGGTWHVRIDNFQRPLNTRNLLTWLKEKLQVSVSEDALWINAIKTHCYIDFPTKELAQKCIDTVTGVKFTPTCPLQLAAFFTDVSVAEAPTSAEANAKPGEWQKAKNSTTSPRQKGTPAAFSPTAAGSSAVEAIAAATGEGAAAAASPRLLLRLGDGARDIVKRAAAVAADSAKVTAAGAGGKGSTSIQGNTISGFSTRKHRTELGLDTADDGSGALADAGGAAQDGDIPAKNLDDYFKKTQALPMLYWRPVSDEEVRKRKEGAYKSRSLTRADADEDARLELNRRGQRLAMLAASTEGRAQVGERGGRGGPVGWDRGGRGGPSGGGRGGYGGPPRDVFAQRWDRSEDGPDRKVPRREDERYDGGRGGGGVGRYGPDMRNGSAPGEHAWGRDGGREDMYAPGRDWGRPGGRGGDGRGDGGWQRGGGDSRRGLRGDDGDRNFLRR